MQPTRREFVKTAACAAGASFLAGRQAMAANLLNRPIGLEMYTVGADFEKDPLGTMQKVAALGYRLVEVSPASPMSKVAVKDIKKGLADTGLKNPSGHYLLPDLQ